LGAAILIRIVQLSLKDQEAYRLLCDSATGILGGELHLLSLRLLDFLSRHFERVYIPKSIGYVMGN
jgi:hypothetical protein